MTTKRTAPEIPHLLTTEQVAAACGVGVRTVKTWIAAGTLTSVLLGRRCRRVEVRDLAEFVEAGRVEARRPRRRR